MSVQVFGFCSQAGFTWIFWSGSWARLGLQINVYNLRTIIVEFIQKYEIPGIRQHDPGLSFTSLGRELHQCRSQILLTLVSRHLFLTQADRIPKHLTNERNHLTKSSKTTFLFLLLDYYFFVDVFTLRQAKTYQSYGRVGGSSKN